ncbi:DNA polymerase III subunit chi [Magnetospirillum moscoviense]|uniref:DNA polymerase III subunit chi n=1 Tax=Magnetospirillum moscoviense TaxID=1437059 RepID=A0A178M767_9PROT|nr:DNA polymerase III subunit chi [Magnetospirillum moscoviense]MBF0325625.1 DNA polymerase III subunit chi [Alphaproteobacteria bacterium]OAN44609.1 DNA polymerase III subunit chi [Magnetospirillum moscoviense]
MAQIGFYHLLRLPLEQALPRLLDKAVTAGMRAVVMAGSAERVEDLNALLWTYAEDSWLPHGSRADGEPAHQPVWLTDCDENPNGATVLVLCDGVVPATLAGFSRCLDLFDGTDEQAVAAARGRWKAWKEAGHELVYYQQTERGGWEEKARS